MAQVALVRGKTRYDAVRKALELIKKEVNEDIKEKENIVVKPNLVSPYQPLSSTQIDTVKATLDFLNQLTDKPITIAEGSAYDTATAYKNYRYLNLEKEYNVKLVDLNSDDHREVEAFDSHLNTIPFQVAKTVLDSDYIISSAVLKTHDTVIATMAIKNIVVGSLIHKKRIHQGYPATNLNIYKIARRIWPKLAIIDGFVAMEGRGPESGEPVDLKIAIASNDTLAADVVGAYIMGFDPEDIGYLHYCRRMNLGEGDIQKIKVVGEDVYKVRRKFKPHPNYEAQKKWKIKEELLPKLLI
ncbi:MAG: DUF362 domain-containing protein [Nitrososphaeria archaeon]